MVQELNAPNRIAILGSTDDGLHFHQMLLPSQYPGHEEGTMYIQGDPSVAIDSTGTAWVLGHELKLTATGCDDPAQRSVHSKIILASIGADFPAVFEPIDALWDVATPGAPDPDTYLDHPMMTITSDDRQHFVWWDQTAATILYRSRLSTQALGSPGTEPVVLPAALGAPYILSGSGNNVYVHDANFLCTVSGPAGLSCASGLIGMAAAVSGSPSSPIEIPGSPYDLRGPGASLAASPALGAHLYYAYLCTDGAGTTYDSSQFQGPWNVCFAESADGGLSWPAPLLLSNAGSEQGTDQFGPLVLAMGNGDVVVTYYDRSADPLGNSGTIYGERVAYRRGGVWYHGQRNAAALGASDLSLLPRKCFNNTHLFMGDYRISIGGFSHGHDLRVDTLPAVFPQVTTARLRVGTLSPTSWE